MGANDLLSACFATGFLRDVTGYDLSTRTGLALVFLGGLLLTTPASGQYQLLDIINPEFEGMPPQIEDNGPRFGSSVAASGRLLMVGAPKLLLSKHGGIGSVEVGGWSNFRRQGDRWELYDWVLATATAEDQGSERGRSLGVLDLGLNRIELSGTPGYDNSLQNRGTIRAACREVCGHASNHFGDDANDLFGQSLAVIGDSYAGSSWMVVGAPGGDYVKVFRRHPNEVSWHEDAVLTASNGNPGDLFGYSVAIDVTSTTVWVVVGAPQHANLAGAAYVYYRNASGVWAQVDVVQQPSPQAGDLFGAAVAYQISGLAVTDHLLAVGAPNRYPAGNPTVGYRRGTVSMFRQGPFPGDFTHDGDASFNTFLCAAAVALCENREQAMSFGFTLAFHDSDLWIGAPTFNQSDGANVGRVYRARLGPVFNNTGWWLREMLSPGALADEECEDEDSNVIGRENGRFGTSLAVVEQGIAVGYPGRGCARAFPPYTTYPRTGQVRVYGIPDQMFSDRFEP